jgi:hypothetical protein
MHAKGHRIEANFTLCFTLFIVTFAKGGALLMSFFRGSKKQGGFQGFSPSIINVFGHSASVTVPPLTRSIIA